MNLKDYRKKRGWSQARLAQEMGVSRSTIAMWETNNSQPDHESLLKLSELFGKSIDDLLGNPLYSLAEEKYTLDKFKGLDIKTQQQLLDNALSEQEQHLIDCFRSMNEQGQAYILQTIDMAKEIYKTTDQTGSGSGYHIAAFGAKETEADDQPPIGENIL